MIVALYWNGSTSKSVFADSAAPNPDFGRLPGTSTTEDPQEIS